MATKLPIKTRILEWCIENDRPVTSLEVTNSLANEYPGERTAEHKNVEKQMDLFCKLGFMQPTDIKEQDGEPEVIYQMTEAGRRAVKYIPGHGNKLF